MVKNDTTDKDMQACMHTQTHTQSKAKQQQKTQNKFEWAINYICTDGSSRKDHFLSKISKLIIKARHHSAKVKTNCL